MVVRMISMIPRAALMNPMNLVTLASPTIRMMMRLAFVLVLIVGVSIQGHAQTNAAGGSAQGEQKTRSSGGPRKQLATIIFCGLGGAILGLSTLSFYGRPQDKLSNIAIGFAFGVIAGTSYVTYKAATNPAEFYGTSPTTSWLEQQPGQENLAAFRARPEPVPFSLGYKFTF